MSQWIVREVMRDIYRTPEHGELPGQRPENEPSDSVLTAKLKTTDKEIAGFEADSDYAHVRAASISWQEIREYLKSPHGHYPPEKLHAIFERCGHVREVADYLADNSDCWAETAIGLYRLHRHDKEFVCRIIQGQGICSPDGILNPGLAQLIFEDHIRHSAGEDYPILTRRMLRSIAAATETLEQITATAKELLGGRTEPSKNRRSAQILASPQKLKLTNSTLAPTATITIENRPIAINAHRGIGYKITYELHGDKHSSRQVFLLGDENPMGNILFSGNGLRGVLLEPEAQYLLEDLTNPAALQPSETRMRKTLLIPAN